MRAPIAVLWFCAGLALGVAATFSMNLGPSASGQALAQAPATRGPWTIEVQPYYSAPGAWRLNSITGALSFCANQSSVWKCIPVAP